MTTRRPRWAAGRRTWFGLGLGLGLGLRLGPGSGCGFGVAVVREKAGAQYGDRGGGPRAAGHGAPIEKEGDHGDQLHLEM